MADKMTGQYETTVQYIAEMSGIVHRYCPERVNAILEWGAGASTTLFYNLAKANDSSLLVTIDHMGDYL